ncbi:hypothetical protein B0I35DRAFT_435436 [Stachybotrys elegans]|uniref:Uncharacterized protein n=1 Tax=Stachybotrys elegans TaxID=80388 RepID=A0A8K0SNP7_9HYPO|nr:hypothetical protein B0I35DRAFT_435436 [Stachybotrys elegans]
MAAAAAAPMPPPQQQQPSPYPSLDDEMLSSSSPQGDVMRSEREARDARQAARAAKNQNSNAHYRRSQPQSQSQSQPPPPLPPADDPAVASSYAGTEEVRTPTSTSDAGLYEAMLAQAEHRPPRNGQYRRQQGQPPVTNSPPRQQQPSSGHARRQSEAHGRRPVSPMDDPSMSGATINRLKSPSIMKSVLLPLEHKILEYEQLMDEAEAQMLQLDQEILALQERRRQAEDRYVEAKHKHDEYDRQHQDVGRALRGDLEVKLPPQAQPQPQAQARMSMPAMDRMDSYDNRPLSPQSTAQKTRKGGFRMSLFRS